MAECQPLQTNKIKYGIAWPHLGHTSHPERPQKSKSLEGIADNEACNRGRFQQALNGIAVASLQKNNDPLPTSNRYTEP